ncbi:MAG TPA: EamA family transporter [Vicinamibacteria bacterium]|nr:EamA family transporter [Vicinamibacteria bacterium]
MIGAPLLALAAALGFAVGGVLLRRGLQHASPLAAAAVSVSFTGLFVWTLTALRMPLGSLLTSRALPFLAAGLLAPGLGRLLLFVGVDRVGVARSSTLLASSPLFAIGLAALVLGERPTWLLLVGAAAVVAGATLLAARQRAERAFRRLDLAFPVLAALSFATRDNISRAALADFPRPLAAAAVATLASVVVMWAYVGSQRGRGRFRLHPRGLAFIAMSGLCEGGASLSMWTALEAGEVALVSPLVHAQPLFTVALAALFLRDLERVTWRTVLAAALIVAGVGLVIRAHVA